MIFDLNKICDNFKIQINGVIHVGAFVGDELDAYRQLGLTNTILFEPQKHLYEIVQAKCRNDEKVFNVALGSHPHEANLIISQTQGGIFNGSGASSSLLPPKKHLTEHPNITFGSEEWVQIECLDPFLPRNHIDITGYNFLNIDVQGYELEVLKGGTKTLSHIDAMIVEVNRDEMYEGCPMIQDIDDFLQGYKFTRELTYWQSTSWGDALYVKH